MKYSFIMCAYKDYASLDKCLDLIKNIPDKEVIIWDNTPKELVMRREWDDWRGPIWLGDGVGIGYASGCNNAVKYAKGEILVFLNPDTEPTGDWLERMTKGLEEYDAVGSTSDYIAGFQKSDFWKDYPKPFAETRLLIPVCMVIKAETYREIPFDNSFFLGCEDLDWSWRMGIAGKRLGIATDVFVHHVGHTGFSVTPNREAIIKAGEARMREKLKEYYGEKVPTSEEVWGCKILATELKPMRLSVCMISKERSDELTALLRSLWFADEIVVVHTGEPETPDGKWYGAMFVDKGEIDFRFKFDHFPWVDDFAAARNYALSKCTGDWVLWLDADDRVPEESANLIDALIHKPGNNVALQACHFAFRVENTNKDWGVRDSFFQSRIFPRLPGIEWGGIGGCKGYVHESYFEACQQLGLPMVQVNNITIRHTGYSDPELEKKKAERNLKLLHKEPDNCFKWYNIGCSYMAMGEGEKAEGGFRRALALGEGEDPFFLDNCRYNVAMSLHKRGLTEDAFPFLDGNRKPDAKWLLGMLKIERGDVESGCDLLWEYLRMGDVKDNLGTNCLRFRKVAVDTLTEIGVLKV